MQQGSNKRHWSVAVSRETVTLVFPLTTSKNMTKQENEERLARLKNIVWFSVGCLADDDVVAHHHGCERGGTEQGGGSGTSQGGGTQGGGGLE